MDRIKYLRTIRDKVWVPTYHQKDKYFARAAWMSADRIIYPELEKVVDISNQVNDQHRSLG